MELRDYQKRLDEQVRGAWAIGARNVCMVSPTGCHARGTRIMMATGESMPVERVKIGDLVMGPDSKPRRVIHLHRGIDRMYRVRPTKGEPFVVNAGHVFRLYRTPEKKGQKPSRIEATADEVMESSGWFKHIHKLERVGIDLPKRNVSIDPWLVGVMLGDGCLTQGTPQFCTPDSEVLDAVTEHVMDRFGCKITAVGKHLTAPTYLISDPKAHRGNPNRFRLALDEIGINGCLSGDKFIPPQYMFNDRNTRLELIAGLVDTDGHLAGHIDWISKSAFMAEQFTWLCRSVGLAAYIKKCQKSNQHGFTGTYWRVSVSGELSIIPCRVKRKQAGPRRQIKNALVTGFKMEAIGRGEYFGFEIDGDHLYLTDDFTIHHNSGKTHTKTHIAKQMGLVTCNIAHRQELVVQISESLASFGVVHNIVAPVGVVRFCASRHVQRFGRSFFDQNAPQAVAGVQTLLRRVDQLGQFVSRVKLWDIDECHHCLPGNQWGKATELFPHALGLGVTATPLRADRKGLDGIFDHMIVGPTMRDLINDNHLSEYRIFCPPQSIDTDAIRVSGSTGEYVKKDVLEQTDKSQIVGDVVSHYLRIAPGKRGLTFAVSIESAEQIAAAYNAAGVPAAVVSGKTPDHIRTDMLDRLARGEILQLVNVDLFGEGMDCPALEVISMARPTQSYGLYVQQFGRVLRVLDGKTHGIVIDHVGNVVRHGLPDRPREWSLAAPEGRRAKKREANEIKLTACTACFSPYFAHLKACPNCGNVPVPSGRSAPEQVDGDLIELDPAVLAHLRGEIDRIDGDPLIPRDVSTPVAISIKNKWIARQEHQSMLRESISAWAGVFKHGHGEQDSEIMRRFYLTFGIDIATAQTLGPTDADKLREQIIGELI